MKRRVFLLFAIAALMLGAQNVSATEIKGGLEEPQAFGIPESEVSEDVAKADRVAGIEEELLQDTDKWDVYASYYYYNQLAPEYRKAWDELDVISKSYFNASKNVTDGDGYLESVKLPDGMTPDEAKNFWNMFMYSNPQYYFLRNQYRYYYKEVDGEKYATKLLLSMYPAFYEGEIRAHETEEVEAVLDTWQAEIDICETDAEKLKKIQDLICEKVDYNDDKVDGKVKEEDCFSQSAYSVFCTDLTVCAGYADSFVMLCNASGLDAISVSSADHQWNKVRVDDSWYNFDLTWDDQGKDKSPSIVYQYFGRNDDYFAAAHTPKNFWEKYLPIATLDTNPSNPEEQPGNFPAITQQAISPEIMVSDTDDGMQIELSCPTGNAQLYYTTDGTDPAVAANKSYRYKESFEVEQNTQIKAIAVCDTYFDSEIVNKNVGLKQYAITYVLDGGVNHADNPQTYNMCDSVALQSPSKTGYVFEGWYCDKEYTEKVAEIRTGMKGALTLYARWVPITYTVKFDGNGAQGGYVSDMTQCRYDEVYSLTPNVYTKRFHVFREWNTQPDGSGKAYENMASVKNLSAENGAVITLYAQWKMTTYNIAFDGNGATAGMMNGITGCKYDVAAALTGNNYVRTGYTFTGWNTKADGTGTAYADGESVKNLTDADGVTVTLYAQWRANVYSIKYDGNKATQGSMKTQTLRLYGKSYVLSSNKYKRTGYRFNGWNTKKSGKGISYGNKAKVKNLSSKDGKVVTLYARWKANKYHVKFHGNGATSGSMKKLKNRTYDKKFKLSTNKYKRKGYKFIGWNTKKNGKGKMYKNKSTVKNLTSKNGKTVILYAQWKKK